MARYPTLWLRTTMRGCGPDCRRMDLPVEARKISPTQMETRHVAPRGHIPAWLERCKPDD